MYLGYHEEDDICPEKGCEGKLQYPEVVDCSCHISPPCSKCVDNPLTCDECGWEEEAPEYKEIPVAPGLLMREYKPRALDKSKIDYRSKIHTNSTMIKEGCHPKGISREEVVKEVRGTFGGRFEYFGGTTFKYIAYTD